MRERTRGCKASLPRHKLQTAIAGVHFLAPFPGYINQYHRPLLHHHLHHLRFCRYNLGGQRELHSHTQEAAFGRIAVILELKLFNYIWPCYA